jgi:hypothetical protein
MKRRALFLALAAGFLVLGFGALDARAGLVPLPTTLDTFVGSNNPSNYAEVTNSPLPNGAEHLRFSLFTYSQNTGDPPAAAGVTVSPFTIGGTPGETGLSFGGAFNAAAGVTSDWTIKYRVDELSPGALLTDAYLSITGGVNGGTGMINVSETITDLNGNFVGSLESFNGHLISTTTFAQGYTGLLITKDISAVGGNNGVTMSVIDQGYSSVGTPEPASIALLGIGMTGFLALRRFFRKTSVA